ncbi:phosphate/phosphite/phosphonate ABC transporter substrate-binding protein [Thioalkalivibrio sp. ALR17-21]|uniref:phosphate/phosphite/phosphonate ABC transporter substrate-binding protein n=1 Tax=Thioalkalivibrio sp. ALR17-21 TaxID=1269813 RepID=UPI0004190DF1|nr:phosphate/phosphite/phosphonate ABC transporter substrate-binding protein [Thioalkalivibrio sp. ALR17-21]
MPGRTNLPLILTLVLLLGTMAAALPAAAQTAEGPAADADPVTLGILPFASPKTLFQRYAPLRDWLAQTLDREVRIETARNFEIFLGRTDAGRYDLVLTGSHLARRARTHGDYRPLVAATHRLSARIVTPIDSPIDSVQDLAGQTIAAPPRLSMGTVAVRYLLDLPLADNPPEYIYYSHHETALDALQRGLADAAIMVVDDEAGSARPETRDPDRERLISLRDGQLVRMLMRTPRFPGAVILAREDRLPSTVDLAGQLTALSDTPEGRERLNRMGHRGFARFDTDAIPDIMPLPDPGFVLPDSDEPAATDR